MHKLPAILLGFLVAVASWAGDLEAIKAEPNLERRSERAIDNAKHALDAARAAFATGDPAKMKAALDEIAESVEISYAALSDTGKHPRKNPKYFKRAEMSIGELLRRLKSLESDASVDDRPMVEKTELQLHEIRENLVSGIMSKKK